jgi:hypothetical protein
MQATGSIALTQTVTMTAFRYSNVAPVRQAYAFARFKFRNSLVQPTSFRSDSITSTSIAVAKNFNRASFGVSETG